MQWTSRLPQPLVASSDGRPPEANQISSPINACEGALAMWNHGRTQHCACERGQPKRKPTASCVRSWWCKSGLGTRGRRVRQVKEQELSPHHLCSHESWPPPWRRYVRESVCTRGVQTAVYLCIGTTVQRTLKVLKWSLKPTGCVSSTRTDRSKDRTATALLTERGSRDTRCRPLTTT